MLKHIYLIRGVVGAGKSTLAKTLSAALGCDYFEADMFFMVDGEYRFNPVLLPHAHHWCWSKVEQQMSQGIENIVVSNTFTTEKEMKKYFELASDFGYTVTTMIVESRHGNKSVHDVPDEKVQQMRNRFSIKL